MQRCLNNNTSSGSSTCVQCLAARQACMQHAWCLFHVPRFDGLTAVTHAHSTGATACSAKAVTRSTNRKVSQHATHLELCCSAALVAWLLIDQGPQVQGEPSAALGICSCWSLFLRLAHADTEMNVGRYW